MRKLCIFFLSRWSALLEKVDRLFSKNAFTLIELLIVVAIIGILAAIAVPNFINAQIRAKISRVYGDLRSIRTALDMYTVDNGRVMLDLGEMPNWSRSHGALGYWKQLTTPVNYISSSAFYDPFIPEVNRTAAIEAVEQGVYQYRYAKYQNLPRTWVARSPGPDRIYIPWPQKLAYWMAYESSNGLISFGDLMVSEEGILGINYEGRDLPMPSDFTGY